LILSECGGLFEKLDTWELPVSWSTTQPFVIYRVKQRDEERQENKWMTSKTIAVSYDSETALTPRASIPGLVKSMNTSLPSLIERLDLVSLFHELDGKQMESHMYEEEIGLYGRVVRSEINRYVNVHSVNFTKVLSMTLMKRLNQLCTKNMVFLHLNRQDNPKVAELLARHLEEDSGPLRHCIEALDDAHERQSMEYEAFTEE